MVIHTKSWGKDQTEIYIYKKKRTAKNENQKKNEDKEERKTFFSNGMYRTNRIIIIKVEEVAQRTHTHRMHAGIHIQMKEKEKQNTKEEKPLHMKAMWNIKRIMRFYLN